MPLVIACPSCKAKLKVPENAVGKAVKCPGCGTALQVPASAAAPAAAGSRQPASGSKAPAPRREEPADDYDQDEAPRRGAPARKGAAEEERPAKAGGYLGVGFDLDRDDLEITDVYENTPAEKAGLEPGDIIVRIDDQKVSNREDFADEMKRTKPGDKLLFEVKRGKKIVEIDVKLGKRPSE
jgi:predicted Zn finger-like uncharacterized protein